MKPSEKLQQEINGICAFVDGATRKLNPPHAFMLLIMPAASDASAPDEKAVASVAANARREDIKAAMLNWLEQDDAASGGRN